MTNWCYDINLAPKGHYKTLTRTLNGQEVETQVHVQEPFFAAGSDGELVTISKWIVKEERWSMFTKDCPPIAWAPWPKHPGIPPSDAKPRRQIDDDLL